MTHMRPQSAPAAYRFDWSWSVTIIVVVLMIGFRHEVGADWEGYINLSREMKNETFDAVLTSKDMAYGLLNWFGVNVAGDIYFVNLSCAVLFCWGLAAFCRQQPRPWLALLVALPYLITVVAMGYSRQGVAIGLAMLAIAKLEDGRTARFIFWMLMATLFHKSSLVLIPFAAFSASRYRLIVLFGVVISTAVLFVVLIQDQLDYFSRNYVEIELGSSGAGIRLAMNSIPALLFLLFKNNLAFDCKLRSFWLWMAWSALLLIPILVVSPSSTAVDRVALYWIPLQLFVYSRLPDVFGILGRRNPLWVTLIFSYSSSLMVGWLLLSDFASYWLPYRFYPWEALWS